jgi:hypothetical protein
VHLLLGNRGVHHVHDQVGAERLLERRREGLHQLVRQLADEADGVSEQVLATRDLEGAGGRVERVEEPLPHPTSEPVMVFRSVDLPAFV